MFKIKNKVLENLKEMDYEQIEKFSNALTNGLIQEKKILTLNNVYGLQTLHIYIYETKEKFLFSIVMNNEKL